jgi:transposase-like protein
VAPRHNTGVKHHDCKAPQLAKSETVKHLPLVCSNELAAVEFLEATRWGNTPCCVHCGSVTVFKLGDTKSGGRNKRFLWKCRDCKKQYTVRIGTVYEESRIALRHWCLAFWLMSCSKKGVSALQVMRQTGISYKSALFLVHRIRFAMKPAGELPKLTGIVECDETYVGGKPRNVGTSKRGLGTKKSPVFAMLQRDGDVRVQHVAKVNGNNLREHMGRNIDATAHVMTDELNIYRSIASGYASHQTVNHSIEEYVRGEVTTNGVEGFFSILKRGLTGVYHAVSKEHLHRYLSEFQFRYNARKLNDGDRTLLAIRSADGKRLVYRESTTTSDAA